MPNTECVPCAPGGENAMRAVQGSSEAIAMESLFAVERVALVGMGLYVAGVRGERLWHGALAGGLMVELFVLSFAASSRRNQ